MTLFHTDFDTIARKIIDQVGKEVVMAVPLGIGKPVGIINALYRLAVSDPSIQLTIMTALTLARPEYTSDLEKRFVEPFLDRIIGNYEDPLYEKPRVKQQLPANINVIEFFLTTGKYLHNSYVQQHYISSTYSLAVRDSLHQGVNVYAQQVSPGTTDRDVYSLSSNSDLFQAACVGLEKLAQQGKKIAIAAEINANLPFMQGEAIVPTSVFTDVVDTKTYPHLFAVPHDEMAVADHLIGLYTSFLIPDDSTLQIGIGKLGNAVANALLFRQKQSVFYQELATALNVHTKFGATIQTCGSLDPFTKGINASTEMLFDGYLQLYKADILKKRVYDHLGLQRLLNSGAITEKVTPLMLDVLLEQGIIQPVLTALDVYFLKQFGIFRADVDYDNGKLRLPAGEQIIPDLSVVENRQRIAQSALGERLTTGKIIHAGFFLGTNDFYNQLRQLTKEEVQLIDMTTITRTNTLSWSPELLRAQRQRARFVNATMMVTLSGGAISDGLKNLQEVSGVGGQFDFVSMAHSLDGARSILMCPAVRDSAQGVTSNIVWDYPNFTIPRFLRDIVVTEYGIADCRSKMDADVIKALLNVTDSRFQPGLLAASKRCGKIEKEYVIPAAFCQNYPDKNQAVLKKFQAQGFFGAYPFGTEFTPDELIIMRALLVLKNASAGKKLWLLFWAMCSMKSDTKFMPYLERMQLAKPKTLQEFIYKKLLKLIIASL